MRSHGSLAHAQGSRRNSGADVTPYLLIGCVVLLDFLVNDNCPERSPCVPVTALS